MFSRFVPICAVVLLPLLPGTAVSGGNGPGFQFERIGPFGGDVRSLLIDSNRPEIAYLGTSAGKIFKTTDSGKSWLPLYPGIGPYEYVIDTLVQHPDEPDHIYAGSWDLHSDGGGLFESKDAGLSWSQVLLPRSSSAVRGFAVCGADPKYMILGTLSGVHVSSDGGRSWKQAGGDELLRTESVAIDPKDHRNLYAGTWRLGYRSRDFGKTWTKADKGMPLDSDLFSISVDSCNPQTVYASACSGVYRSSNGAASWTRLRLLPGRSSVRARVVLIDPVDPHRIYAGTTEGLFTSSNDGGNWKRLTSADVTVNAVQVDPRDTRRIMIGTEYRGILLTEDGGRTWAESNSGFVHRQISWILPDPAGSGQFFSGLLSGSGGICVYDSGSRSWFLSQIEPWTRILSFSILPENRGRLAGTSQGVYWQAKAGGLWKKLSGSIAGRTIYSLESDPSSPVVYAGTDRGVYRTSLQELKFRTPPNYRLSPKVWCILAPKTSDGMIYAGTTLGLLRSRDRGTTWNVISASGLPARTNIASLAVSPSDNSHMFAGTSVGLFESIDGGIHWKRAGNEAMHVEISSVLFLDGSGMRLLAANKTSGGVFHSTDGGKSWNIIFSAGNASPVYCLTQDPQTPSIIYMGTRSDGVYSLKIGSGSRGPR